MITISLITNAQKKSFTGFLFPSLDLSDSISMDFFLIAEIDSTMSLKDNLLNVRSDTLIRVNLSNPSFVKNFHIMNEVTGSILQVVPVKIIWSDWTVEDNFLHNRIFMRFPISIMNKEIVSGYDGSRIRSFAQLTILNIKDDVSK